LSINKVKQSPSAASTYTDPLAPPPVLSGSSHHHARSTVSKAASSGSIPSSKSSQRLFVIFAVALVGGAALIFATAAYSLSWSNFDDIQTAVERSIEEFKSISRKMEGETKAEEGGAAKSFTSDSSSSSQSSVSNAAAPLAHLSCAKYGGPADEDAQEMVYWKDIGSDRRYVSPFHVKASAKIGQRRQYMTFEPDGGGWNNIRMAMETVLGLAIAMGRTLVLPPSQKMYLLGKTTKDQQKVHFSFADFFPMEEMARENDGLEIITMKEFLETEAMTGNLRHKDTGKTVFPPGNRTDWEGISRDEFTELKEYLREVSLTPLWGPGHCLAAFPASGDHKDVENLKAMQEKIHKEGLILQDPILDNPPPVDSSPIDRMRENLVNRNELCVYDEEMQKQHVVHFMCNHKMRVRMLVHFYAFLFFEDWREDLWMKRFMRDHVRYIDEIQCAAARIVHAMRDYALSKTNGKSSEFDTFHVRRGDFQFKRTRISAQEIYENTKNILEPGAILYIATDERDKGFFDPLKKHYDVKFMDDFMPVLKDVNTNYFGMIDQLVASRGRLFFGCWHSTFTGFINRMRGYHSVNHKWLGHEKGELNSSFYYVTMEHQLQMHKYAALNGAFFNREFPTSWRDLDKGIGQLPVVKH